MEGKQERGSRVAHGNTINTSKVGNGEKRAKDVEKLMKAIILPQCSFRPPDTIIDVVDFVRKKSRELDTRNIPDDQRGINFALEFPPGKTGIIPNCGMMKNASLWDALTHFCTIAQPAYEFEVTRSGVVVVRPKSLPSN